MDFDAETFRKHYGSVENPGIYAIPEEEVEPTPEEQQQYADPNDQSDLEKGAEDQQKIDDALLNSQTPPMPQLSQEQQVTYDAEVTPIKKLYLLNKLYQLSHLLKNKFSSNEELDLILKFGSNLSYNTLQVLAINVINNLKELAQQQEGISAQPQQSQVAAAV